MSKKNKIIKIFCLIVCLALVVAVIYGAVNFAVLKSCKKKKLDLSENFTVTAHTGSMDTAYNSIESIENAIRVKADIVEFDVRFRPDSTPVMSHDVVSSNDAGVPIETALQFISQNSDDIKINLDVKETDNLSAVQTLVEKYGLLERAFFTGVTEEFVPEVRRQCPKIPYYLNYFPVKYKLDEPEYQQELLQLLENTGAVGINCNYITSDKHLAELLHQNGYLLSVWTINSKNQMILSLFDKPDNITTKNPDVLIDLIENWNK